MGFLVETLISVKNSLLLHLFFLPLPLEQALLEPIIEVSPVSLAKLEALAIIIFVPPNCSALKLVPYCSPSFLSASSLLSPVPIQSNCSFKPLLNCGWLVLCFHQFSSNISIYALFKFFNQWTSFISATSCCSFKILHEFLHISSFLFYPLQFCYF